MLDLKDKRVFYSIGSGFGVAKNELNAFDRALLASGCANYNLVRVSSILPSNAQCVPKINYKEGSIVPTAYAKSICNPTKEKTIIAAAVAVGIPYDSNKVGIIMEWSGNATEELARENVISMVDVAMKDRNETDYAIIISSVEKESSSSDFTCVFAYIALLPQ